MKARTAFSLTELLVVIGIIILLAALLFPVLSSAKKKSLEVPCTANLKQLGTAWQLYMQSNNDQMPLTIGQLRRSSPVIDSVLKCPADQWRGANAQETERNGKPISYRTLDQRIDFRTALSSADPNHGIFVCICHGHSLQADGTVSSIADLTGAILRLRLDLSVQKVLIPHRCGPATANGRISGRNLWSLMTDATCPVVWSDGLVEPCE